jgi:hypothetical protein
MPTYSGWYVPYGRQEHIAGLEHSLKFKNLGQLYVRYVIHPAERNL